MMVGSLCVCAPLLGAEMCLGHFPPSLQLLRPHLAHTWPCLASAAALRGEPEFGVRALGQHPAP